VVESLFASRYQIARLLGSGGMGTVYEARDNALGRRVALKIPHAHLMGPSQRTRFRREAQASARIWHPNICPIFDIGEVDSRLYITMAYLEGRPLGSLVHEGEPVGMALAMRLVRTMAHALQTAHDAGVLHLDLKPANVMVGANHNPIIMDFGLSRLVADGDDSLTLDAGLLGTPAYMAPEQIASQPEAISAVTDIYGLGVIFYELLTGRPPFRGSVLSVMAQAQADQVPPPRTICPTLDERVADVCLRMLAKSPGDRPRSMNEVVDLLEIIEGSERAPIDRGASRPPSDRERLRDAHSRRHAWEALYYAKRLLQVNQHDVEAYNVLSEIAANPRDLVCFDEARKQYVLNAFTRSMDTRTLVDFVVESGLVERDDGDVICRYNDPSDNMFLILRGEVGVFKPHAESLECGPSYRDEPDFRFGPGHIVGELAFALKRSRTATMRALGRASLLAFSFSRLKQLADRGVMGTALSTSVDAYLKRSVLKYIFDAAKYLSSSCSEIVDRWQLVNHHAEVFTIDHQQYPVLQADTCARFTERRGLVILASGQLRGQHVDGKVLREHDLPILFAHFDNRLAYTYPRYEIDRAVTLVHLHQAAFQELDHVADGYLHEVIGALRNSCAAQFHYDIFLSYTNRDRELAAHWKSRLEESGLRIYMDVQHPPKRFVPVIEAAILDSLVLMPLLTENTAARAGRDSWVHREISFRSNVFGERACIVPVNFGGGRVARLSPGDLPIEAMGRESEAIEQTVSLVRRLRNGELSPPYSLNANLPEL
jgi:serine/threonine protein kinase